MPENVTASSTPLTKPQEQAQPQPQEPKTKKPKRERDLEAEIKALEEKKQALIAQHKKAETRKKIIFGGLAINAFKEMMNPKNQKEIRETTKAILAFIGKIASDKDKATVEKVIKTILEGKD